MYNLVEYNAEYKEKWDEFIKDHGTIFHTIEWKKVLEETFNIKTHYLLALDENKKIKAIAPMAISRNLSLQKVGLALPFVNYLDIAAENETARTYIEEKLNLLIKDLNLNYIELRYKDFSFKSEFQTAAEDNFTFILPLDGGEEKVMELSSSNNRNHIRKTYKNQWYTSAFGWDRLNEFYEVYSHTMKRLGSPCPSIKLLYKIKELMSDNVTLLTVIDSETNKVIGGMSLFTWRDTVYYQWGGALEDYNKKYINNFMYWEAVKYSIEKGYKFLDLGRSPKDSGTFKFKSHFGARAEKLTYYRLSEKTGTIKQVEKDDVKWAIEIWKRMPKVLTDAAGKILIKYVLP